MNYKIILVNPTLLYKIGNKNIFGKVFYFPYQTIEGNYIGLNFISAN